MHRRALTLFAASAALALLGCPLTNTTGGDLSVRPLPSASAGAQASSVQPTRFGCGSSLLNQTSGNSAASRAWTSASPASPKARRPSGPAPESRGACRKRASRWPQLTSIRRRRPG